MCFSSEVSFGTGVLLAGTGVVSVGLVSKPWQRPFAAIPLLFAVQQLAEGFLWIALKHADYGAMYKLSMHGFLVFAWVVWPVWVPYSLWKLEKNAGRKKILAFLLAMGITEGLYLAVCMVLYHVGAKVYGHHIRYIFEFPGFLRVPQAIAYVMAIVVAPFVSSVKRMPFLAVVAFISFSVSELLFANYVISVWCFFAAIISVVVIWVEWKLQSRKRREELLQKLKIAS